MPVTTGSQSLLASLPSFMSVFGDGLRVPEASEEGAANNNYSSSRPASSSNHKPSPSSHNGYLYRRRSSNTFRSESTDSSPTTTVSTADSTLTEPSPSSSPESPTISLNSSFSSQKSSASGSTIMENDAFPASPPPQLASFGTRADSPGKKFRNTKNLSLNPVGSNKLAFNSPMPRLPSSLGQKSTQHANTAPASPSFQIPPKAPNRKPSKLGLTITTPENNQLHRSASDGIVPPTPSFARLSVLRNTDLHSDLPLASPSMGPAGGMRLPSFGVQATSSIPKGRPSLSLSHSLSFDSSRSSPIVQQTLEHVPEENDHDLPLSREVKSPAYPEGPVCIYDPLVYLYLEPNDREASTFDVIINVAREVRNPFDVAREMAPEPKTRDVGVQVELISEPKIPRKQGSMPEPPSAVSENSFQPAFERFPSQPSPAATPRASAAGGPEYIHIPWDHNTNIANDMLKLCETIDNRVSQGKRVLIHCQCGVSRSASLIVAYGLYKNPDLSVQEAYDAVKARSRWIGPNMHLIYQLSEFKTTLSKKNPRRGLGMKRGQTDSLLQKHSPSFGSGPPSRDETPNGVNQESVTPRSNSLSPPDSARTHVRNGQITPGPSSAPADVHFPERRDSDDRRVSVFMEDAPPLVETPPIHTLSPQPMAIDVVAPTPPAPLSPSTTYQENPAERPSTTSNSSPSEKLLPALPAGFTSLSHPKLSKPASSLALRRAAHPSPLPLHTAPSPPPKPAPQPLNIGTGNVNAFSWNNNSQAPARPVSRNGHKTVAPILPPHMISDAPPPTPSLLSPRAKEFTASPFHRTVAGDLAGSSIWDQLAANSNTATASTTHPRLGTFGLGGGGLGGGSRMASFVEDRGPMSPGTRVREVERDPRSPPAATAAGLNPAKVAEEKVWRSIDDVL